ncbi:MAG: glycosyltransferase family 4 protein, partial [Crenarchaeota archaeon]|nr:glycosyltransferase family 4 protein [Thermoproteota archaeon]
GIVFQTQQAREWFPRCIQKRSAIIFNQVGEQFYQDYPVSKKEGIVTVGRLTKQKNHALLIEAFSLIHHKVEDNLYIYGDGALKSALEELITEKKLQKRVFLMGTNDHIETEIASKKLFVLPSDYEGMPNCLMEAMAMGVACISTNCSCGGPKELLGDIESIALCPINSAEKLADLMLVALVDNNRLIELSNYGKNKAEDFRTEVIFKKWRSYIENGQ